MLQLQICQSEIRKKGFTIQYHLLVLLQLVLSEQSYLYNLLLQEVQRIAKDEGYPVVRWITGRENNEAALRLYDEFGEHVLDLFQMEGSGDI